METYFYEIQRENCKLIYEVSMNSHEMITRLIRCVPNAGMNLYEIVATYAKYENRTSFYYLGKSRRDASCRFKDDFGYYMKVVSVIDVPKCEYESILTDRNKMPTR